MMLLGFNSMVRGPTKQGSYSALEHCTVADTSFSIAFLAPFGIYESDSTVAVEHSPNGSFAVHDVGDNTNYFECYDGYGDDSPNKEPAFPFHPQCYVIGSSGAS